MMLSVNNTDFIETLELAKNIIGDVFLVGFFLLFLYMFFVDGINFFKMVYMVLKLYRSKKRRSLIEHMNFLLKTDSDFVDKVTNFDYLRTWYGSKVESIIKKNTTYIGAGSKIGVKNQKETSFYTDLQKACISDKDSLEVLAFALALEITKKVQLYGKQTYVIVGLAGGNSILSNRVASILGLRYVVVGDLAGKKENIFGTIYPSEVAIIIDDVLFAGPMMYDGMNILKEKNIKTEIVAVVLVRSLGYLDFFAQYAEKWNENVDLIYLKKYLDTDFENIIKK